MESADADDVLYRYKYRTMSEGNLKIITEGTLRFSSPMDFNDPFDSTPAYDAKSIDELYKRRPDLIKRVGDAMGLSPAERIMNKGKLLQNARRVVESGEWSRAIMSTVGVFCLSRNPCNPLMWAHYAQDHRGFMVEFKIHLDADDTDIQSIIPHPVIYSEERPFLEWAERGDRIEYYFLTKSKDWEHEKEERVLNVHEGPGDYPYSRESFLSSVTAGLRMNDAEFERLRRAVDKASCEINREIPVYRAKLSHRTYKVYIPGHPNLAVSSPE